MTRTPFERKRYPAEWILVAAAVLSLFLLAQYPAVRPHECTPRGFMDRFDLIVDSVLTARDMSRDSVSVLKGISTDHELISAVSDSIGVLAAVEYLDSSNAQEYQFSITMRITHSDGFNFNFGSNNTSARSDEIAVPESNLITNIWCDADGNIVGVRETVPDDNFSLDSATILGRLQQFVPGHFHAESLEWQQEKTSESVRAFRGVLESDGLVERVLLLRARMQGESQPLVEWRLEADPLRPAPPSDKTGLTGIVYSIIFSLIVIGLIVLGIVRLVQRAVNLVFFLTIAFLATLYYFLASISVVDLHIALVIIVFLFQLIFLGLLTFSIPISGIFSLAREVFSERFYTALRLVRSPLSSHFLGRSIVMGISAGFVYSAIVPLSTRLLAHLGQDSFLVGSTFSEQLLSLAMFPIPAILLGFIVYVPLINTAAILFFPAVVWRFAPRNLRVPLAALGTLVVSVLVQAVFSGDFAFGLLFGSLSGIAALMLFLRYDVLCVIAFNLISNLTYLLFSFDAQPILTPVLIVVIAAVFILAVIAYLRQPEDVSEDDYKPAFLYRMEEEKRIQREIEAAKTVQQRLLPDKLPDFPSVNVAASCVPAFEVGGDYYDFFTLDDNRLGLLIGDVSGKGMSAAFYITLAKGVIVSQIRQVDGPADVLHRVNSLLYEVMERGRFISMIYAVYDTRTRVLEFANAGHNPMLRRRGDNGEVEAIASRGMAIGLDSGKNFDKAVKAESITLETDDVVVFYTDGVTEAMQISREEFSEKRLIDSISRAAGSAAEVVASILDSVNRFVGKARQHDDITILAIQVAARGKGLSSKTTVTPELS